MPKARTKEAAGLFKGEVGVEVAAGEVTNGGEDDDDGEEGAGAVHHDGVALAAKAGGSEKRPGEEDGSDEKCADGPGEGETEDGDEEHAEAGGHAHGRNEELARSHGGAAFANAPEEDAAESD